VEDRLGLEELRDPHVQQLVKCLQDLFKQGKLPADHKELLRHVPRGSQEWEGSFARWLDLAQTVSEKERALDELLEKMHSQRRRDSLENLKTGIRQAEASGDERKTASLIREYNRLVKESVKVSS
jgi:hypothetical protein